MAYSKLKLICRKLSSRVGVVFELILCIVILQRIYKYVYYDISTTLITHSCVKELVCSDPAVHSKI